VIIKNHTQSRPIQKTSGKMHIPNVQPMHCIIAMCARSSSLDVSIAMISGLKKIDNEVNIEANEAIANKK
jgi:hypothetical protein